jgi:hypothetical protein
MKLKQIANSAPTKLTNENIEHILNVTDAAYHIAREIVNWSNLFTTDYYKKIRKQQRIKRRRRRRKKRLKLLQVISNLNTLTSL